MVLEILIHFPILRISRVRMKRTSLLAVLRIILSWERPVMMLLPDWMVPTP